MVAGVISQTASAGEVAPAQFDNATENPYRSAWDSVAEEFGQDTAGRHIVALGWRNAETGAVREPTRSEVVEATERLKVALNPPPVVAVAETTVPSAPAYSSGGDLGSIAACESGGDPTAVDPSGTYMGAFQFDQPTWTAAGGSGSPLDHSYEEQAAIAAGWIAAGNRGAWPNC